MSPGLLIRFILHRWVTPLTVLVDDLEFTQKLNVITKDCSFSYFCGISVGFILELRIKISLLNRG